MLATQEGGDSYFQLDADLPALDWYFVIITTYGCGSNDDEAIGVQISHDPPDYDLLISSSWGGPQYNESHPDDGVWVDFVIEDVGSDPIPCVDLSYFPSPCACDYDYAYPVNFAVYAGHGLIADSLDYAEYVCTVDTFYMGDEISIGTSCGEYIEADWGDASESWNVFVKADYLNELDESNENNNCSLVAVIDWYHHIHGYVQADDWNYLPSLRGINGVTLWLAVYPGPVPMYTTTEYDGSQDGFFEFWVPHSAIFEDAFSVACDVDIQGLAVANDVDSGRIVVLETPRFVKVEDFSDPIILRPFGYTKGKADTAFIYTTHDDSVFEAAVNTVFGIEEVNEFMTRELELSYTLPFVDILVSQEPGYYSYGNGMHTLNTNFVIDWRKFYSRDIIHELGHFVHECAILPRTIAASCGTHTCYLSTNRRCAMAEGWAMYFSAIIPFEDPTTTFCDNCLKTTGYECVQTQSIESNDWLDYYIYGEGDEVEGAIATVLYDMYDRQVFPYAVQDDSLTETFSNIYHALDYIDSQYLDIFNFASEYNNHIQIQNEPDYAARIQQICQVLQDNLINDTLVYLCMSFICGDANGDRVINVGDVTYLMNFIFKSGDPPEPMEAGDANCDGAVNIGDPVYIINYVFKGGPVPCCP
ncbi:MAG: hypothetical protein GY841_14105 [FCB group bacterium]|nr:hypothetical protein [FCB group bacterium]